MIGDSEAYDEFVTSHRWAVLTTMRGGQPVSSVVAYARDGDELLVSTPGFTYKTKSIEKNVHVNLCVISNQEPFNFVAIEAMARVERDDIKADTLRVFDNIAGTGYQKPDDLDGWIEAQQRVILRLVPQRVHGVIR